MNQAGLVAARTLMGDSLGFHIIFVMFGLTLPILVSWFEFMGLRRQDPALISVAKFWSKIMTLLVITGVISGTIIALQMSLVWPGILKFGGEVIGLPFMFETYAFMIEAVFLSLYMATWDNKRVHPWLHWTMSLFIILGSVLSAFAITSINGWMNLPTGFDMVNGQLINIDIWKAVFSQTAIIEFVHSMPAYFFSVTLFVASLYALKLLRVKSRDRLAKKHDVDWFILGRLMALATVLFAVTAVMADVSAKYLAKHEPTKLAVIELNRETQANAQMILGGIADADGNVSGPHVKIPGLLSFLAGNSTDTVVQGFDQVPVDRRPSAIIHVIFDVKMLIVGALILVLGLYLAIKLWRPEWRRRSWFLVGITGVGILGIILVELGWMLTELGRQPWAVRGYVTTAEALTKTHDITGFGYIFPVAYLVLFSVTVWAVIIIVRQHNKTLQRGAK